MSLEAGEVGHVWPAGIPEETTAAGGGGHPETGGKGTEERKKFKANEHGKMNKVRHRHRGRESCDRGKPKPCPDAQARFQKRRGARVRERLLARTARSQLSIRNVPCNLRRDSAKPGAESRTLRGGKEDRLAGNISETASK